MEGFISLHRKLLDWEWYGEPNTCLIFIHCLLKANWKDKSYRGKLVKRGSFLTSLEILAKETGLTIQNVRTALKNLKLTHEITVSTTRQGTEIIINNYSEYQSSTHKVTHESTGSSTGKVTSSQQTPNKQLTTTNKDNKVNKDNKNISAKRLTEFSLPEAWADSALKYWAEKKRPDLDPKDEFTKFQDNHISKGTKSVDWSRNWRTWYTNAVQFTKPMQSPKSSGFDLSNQQYETGVL